MKDTVIFDLDGTLLNTLDDLTDSTNFALRRLGLRTRTREEVRAFVGEGVRLLIERALPGDKKQLTDECLKLFELHYNVNKNNKTKPYRGIGKMLDDVAALGLKTAIVSNKYDEAVLSLRNSLFPQIDIAVGERGGMSKKPAPDMVEYALKQLCSDKDNAVYVGDSDIDVLTARNSGLPIIAVSWGFRPRDLLQSLGADEIIDRPDELTAAIARLK